MVCYEGKFSLECFLTSATILNLLLLTNVIFNFIPNIWWTLFWIPLTYFIIIITFLKFIFQDYKYGIAIRASFLGVILSLGTFVWLLGSNYLRPLGLYMIVMAIFHYGEYLTIAMINPKSLSINSFVLNHSMQCFITTTMTWVEFFMGYCFFPAFKTYYLISLFGLFVCVIGEFLRKTAMSTTRSNFNHNIQTVKAENHILITTGIYRFCRHPSYVGFFCWSFGIQIILLNPICGIIYPCVTWNYLRNRIMFEEIQLLKFFGQQYCDYQKTVPTGLPFIYGHIIKT